MPTTPVKISAEGWSQVDRTLSRLNQWNRSDAYIAGLKLGGEIVAKRAAELAPRGGPRVGRKAGKPHLKDAMGVVVRRYRRVEMVVGGPIYRRVNGANHGHLVERGHRIGTRRSGKLSKDRKPVATGFVDASPFLAPAVNDTQSQVEASVIRGVTAAVEKALSGG